ncbi:MAG TPA: M24 family metallopeptidase, partial [Thermoanaerobaculia bacterium]|nr:M24 family metallopeptidase [Thermoanaerobaculia bacterium]
MAAVLKTPGEIELMDQANRIVHRVLDEVGKRMVAGVTSRELDRLAERVIRDAGGVPAFLNYRGYPATLCISVNDVIVHGIPGDVPLREGDIVGIDCGVLYKGYYGDAARTFAVGEVGEAARKLLRVTEEALNLAVAQVRPGARLQDIGYTVQHHAESHGYS